MKKKFLSLFTAVLMMASLLVVMPAMSAGAETSGDYEYTVLDDGTVEITDYTGSDTDITIPSEIDGKSVTEIGDGAFSGCTSLKSITIPDSVTEIGEGAFLACESLESVTIPDSVTSIKHGTFSGCSSLVNVTIPDSVTSIYGLAFSDCTSLESVTIPDSVTSIGDFAFGYCTSLASVTIPDSVTSIGFGAFYHCTSLASVIIPDSVTSIGYGAFGYYYYDDNDAKTDGFTIYCYSGTAGEQYAIDNGFNYVLLSGDSKPGDVNGDDSLDIKDMSLVYKHINKTELLTDEQVKIADVNNDDSVDIKDYSKIYKHINKTALLW